MKKQSYYLVEAGYSTNNLLWYDLIKALNWEHAEELAIIKKAKTDGCLCLNRVQIAPLRL